MPTHSCVTGILPSHVDSSDVVCGGCGGVEVGWSAMLPKATFNPAFSVLNSSPVAPASTARVSLAKMAFVRRLSKTKTAVHPSFTSARAESA